MGRALVLPINRLQMTPVPGMSLASEAPEGCSDLPAPGCNTLTPERAPSHLQVKAPSAARGETRCRAVDRELRSPGKI